MEESARLRACHSGLFGNIGERSVSVVVIQDVAAILGHIQIGKTVVVVIPPHATKTIASAANSGLFGNISKRSVPIVTIKCVAYRNAAAVEIPAVHEVYVLKAVTVEIRNADARAEYFPNYRDAVVAPEMDELDPG
jgi:hypothetical protein